MMAPTLGGVNRPSGLLIDIDGVLTISWKPLPGAVEALDEVRDNGLGVRFLTNTTSRTRGAVAAALVGAGFGVEEGEILTAPSTTAAYLRRHHPGARCLLINEGDLGDDLEGVELVDSGPVDVVLVGGAGPAFTYPALNRAFGFLRSGASLVAMHRNLVWRTDTGLQLDSGAFITALETASGVDAVVVGKPSAEFFRAGLDSLGLEASEAAMVGDDLHNDVLAAQAVGLTGVQVRTGKFAEDQLGTGTPDHIIDSFADLPALF
jgi:HAD superfamily hydrolase (TIGR01458 family)